MFEDKKVSEGEIREKIEHAKEEGKSVTLSHFIEITEDLELDKVVWYYNNIQGKRYEIERMYFDRFKSHQEWYEVYKLSKPKNVTRGMALEKIRELIENIDDILEIYDVDFHDEEMRKMAFDKIVEVTPDEFDAWLYIYDESIFDRKLNKLALKMCLKYAKTRDNWQKIYDRSEIGSSIQLKAIQQLYGRIELTKEEKEHIGPQKRDKSGYKSQEEYRQDYDEEVFGTIKQENIIVSKYLAADNAAGETPDDEESVTDNP